MLQVNVKNSLTDKQNRMVRKAMDRLLAKNDGNQLAVARALGMNDSSWVSRFVRGLTGASLETATLIARELEEDVGELLQIESLAPRRWMELDGWREALPEAKRLAPELADKAWRRLGEFQCIPAPPEPLTPELLVQSARLVDNLFARPIASGSDQPPPSVRGGGHSRSSGRFRKG